MKRCLSTLILSILLLGSFAPVVAQAPGALVLARVDVTGPLEALGLPVYAHLRDAAGQEYVLVIAPPAQLAQNGSYQALDTLADPSSYLILLPRSEALRRPEARARASQIATVLHDDGRQLIARATPAQAEALAALGYDLSRLPDTPLILVASAAPLRVASFTPHPLVAEMIGQVQEVTVYTYTAQLSGVVPANVGGTPYTIATRHTNSGTSIQKATQFAYEHFQALGLDVSYHTWSASGYNNRNVVAEMPGAQTPDEIVLVTAHIDDMPSGSTAPGADDNGSGSVGVLIAADLMSQHAFARTVRFVLFTGEEQGLLGSNQYANLVYTAGDNIVGVYNMDMIAWDSVNGPTLRLHTRTTGSSGYPGDLAIAGTFTNVVSAYGLSAALTPIIDPDGITASDHSPFWNRGYSAILAIEDDMNDFNTHYHTVNDRLDSLNMAYYTNYVKASVGTAAHLAGPLSGDGTLHGVVTSSANGAPLAQAQVSAYGSGTFSTLTGANGAYTLTLPPATYTVTARAYGYQPVTVSNVVMAPNVNVLQNFALPAASFYTVTGTVTAADGWPLHAAVVVSDELLNPSTSTWSDPLTGHYSLTLAEGITYTLNVTAWTPGYTGAQRTLTPLTGNRREDFMLTADLAACTAPGYGWSGASCVSQPGGLAVGQVTDLNTGSPVPGAMIVNSRGDSVTAAAAGAGNAFYTLFVPGGTQTLTATHTYYGPVTATVLATDGVAFSQDFALPAGLLAHTPSSSSVVLSLGQTQSVPITLTNGGTYALSWTSDMQPPAAWLSVSPSTGALAPGESAILTATLDSAAVLSAGTHTTQLRFATDTPYAPTGVQMSLTVRASDLRVSVTAPSAALAGTVIPVALSYSNTGAVMAESAVLTVTLPQGLDASGPLTWALGDLAPSASGSRSFTATLAEELPSGTSLLIQAHLTSDSREFITTNNTSKTLVIVAMMPQASFVTSAPDALGQATFFTSTATGTSPLTHRWNFGDGGTSSLVSPAHVYGTPGVYTTILTVTNAWGQNSTSMPVTVTAPPPVAQFISSAPHPLGWVTYFTNTSTGMDVAYLWDFGDETPFVSTTNPTHTYEASGEYTVTLTATNSGGTDVFADVITVGPADCVPVYGAAFTFAPVSPTMETLNLGVMVTFTGTAEGGSPPITFDWDFGDTATGSGAVVTHTYVVTGTHTITMTTENLCARIVLTGTLTVAAPPDQPEPRFLVYLPLVMRE
ncbi:MAG: M28 family peptidase [Anaerolineae bacterium]|nr:M28 family peptidase [Anaerolineae bacterium]